MQDNGYQFAMVNYLSIVDSPGYWGSASCGQRVFLLEELEYIQNSHAAYSPNIRISCETEHDTNIEISYNHGKDFCNVNAKTISSGLTIILFK